MAIGQTSKKPLNVLNGRKGASSVPYRDATAAVAAQMGGNSMGGGIEKRATPCRGCSGKK